MNLTMFSKVFKILTTSLVGPAWICIKISGEWGKNCCHFYGKSQEGRKFKSRISFFILDIKTDRNGGGGIRPTESVGVWCGGGWGGDDVRGCYDPLLFFGPNVQNEIRSFSKK
jgi:hypothetical protein